MKLGLGGKKALVLGASKGLGAAIAAPRPLLAPNTRAVRPSSPSFMR